MLTDQIVTLKQQLRKIFSFKDLRELHYFLGIEVQQLSQRIILTQKKFTNDLLKDNRITQFKKMVTSLSHNIKLSKDDSMPYYDPTQYKWLVKNATFLQIHDQICRI